MIDKKDDDNRTNEHFYSKYDEHQINWANMHDDDVNLDAYC